MQQVHFDQNVLSTTRRNVTAACDVCVINRSCSPAVRPHNVLTVGHRFVTIRINAIVFNLG
jgi:hypothetical protein